MAVKLFIQDCNFDIQTEFIDKYLSNISEDFKKNPQFINQLYNALRFLTRKMNLDDSLPPFELDVYDDGRGFEIRSGIRQCPDGGNEELKDNRNYDQVRFTLDEQNVMEVIKSNGVFYKYDDFMKVERDPEVQEVYERFRGRGLSTVVSTFHEHTSILPEGIEVEKSTYSDQCPLSSSFEADAELMRQTMLHSPSKWYYNLLPGEAPYETLPFKTNVFRSKYSLGLVLVSSKFGDSPMKAAEHVAGTEYPDLLTCGPTPLKSFEGGKEVLTDSFQQDYPGMSVWDIEKEMNLIFQRGIETSRSVSINPEAVENLREMVAAGLEKTYGIKQEEKEPVEPVPAF